LFGPYVRPGMTVMDIGCGGGFASLGLARLVGEDGLVISADLQPEMLEIVRERAAGAGLLERIRLHRCEQDRIGLHVQVDFAVAFYMVHEVPDSASFMSEVFALVRPGGCFFLAEPKFHTSLRDFERTLEEALSKGFRVLERPRVILSRAAVLQKEV
jgi:2-polyprenyl-3-methyl-5-hydroxy-6-metoxy-1,4-benzoquinol methylase